MRYRITTHFGAVVFAGLLATSLAEPAFACGNGGFLSQLGCEPSLDIEIVRQMGTPLDAVPFDVPTQIQPLDGHPELFGALLPIDPTQAADPMEADAPIDIIQLNSLLPSCDDNPYWLGCSSWD